MPGSESGAKYAALPTAATPRYAPTISAVAPAPYLVVQESGSLIHELGRMQTTHGGRAAGSGHAYYARWERPASSWVIALGIMAIGEN